MKTKKSIERQHKQVKQRNTHQAKTDKTKYKTRLKKNWTKTQASTANPKHKSKSFDSVGRTVGRRFGRASSSYHSSLILLYIVIAFKLAEARRV
jgi:preprotein translocase subunit SecF